MEFCEPLLPGDEDKILAELKDGGRGVVLWWHPVRRFQVHMKKRVFVGNVGERWEHGCDKLRHHDHILCIFNIPPFLSTRSITEGDNLN